MNYDFSLRERPWRVCILLPFFLPQTARAFGGQGREEVLHEGSLVPHEYKVLRGRNLSWINPERLRMAF